MRLVNTWRGLPLTHIFEQPRSGSGDELKAGSLGYVDGAASLVPDADVL